MASRVSLEGRSHIRRCSPLGCVTTSPNQPDSHQHCKAHTAHSARAYLEGASTARHTPHTAHSAYALELACNMQCRCSPPLHKTAFSRYTPRPAFPARHSLSGPNGDAHRSNGAYECGYECPACACHWHCSLVDIGSTRQHYAMRLRTRMLSHVSRLGAHINAMPLLRSVRDKCGASMHGGASMRTCALLCGAEG
jgi:hypothetical protein